MLKPNKNSPATNNNSPDGEFEELAPIDHNPITKRVLLLQLNASGITFGLFFATGLFLSTIWLLMIGGENVGKNLSLLGYYCPGYSVTWVGSLLGGLYGLFYGYAFGFTIGYIYNKIANCRLSK